MSKKKPKTRLDKISKKHDFSHLARTKTAAKLVATEEALSADTKSPIDKLVSRDLRVGTIIIGVFIVAIVVFWLLVGRNGAIYTFTDKLKLFK